MRRTSLFRVLLYPALVVCWAAANASASASTFTGRFDHQTVHITWSFASSCLFGGTEVTNTYNQSVLEIPLTSPGVSARCIDGNMSFTGQLSVNFPNTTPPGQVGVLQFLTFNTPLIGSIELTGNLVLPTIPAINTQFIKADAGPLEVASSTTCPMNSTTNGPPLTAGTYPISVASLCHRTSMIWPVTDGNDLVYQVGSNADLLVYDPRFPTTQTRVIFLVNVDVTTVYRVNTATGIQLTPTELNFELIRSNPPPATVSLTNTGTTNLTYQATASTDDGHAWLSVANATGTVAPGQSAALSVSIDPDILPKGTNTGRITVTGNAANSPQIVDVTAKRFDVELVALEIVQTVQNWRNTVPLVTDKPTLARAHLQLTRTNLEPLIFPGAVLRGYQGGTELGGSPLPPVNAGALTIRTNAQDRRFRLANSLNFQLPTNWLSGQVQMQFESGTEPVLFSDPAEPGGQGNDGLVSLGFQSSSTFPVKFIQVRWTNAAGTVYEPTVANVNELKLRTEAAMPVARVDATRGQLTWDAGVPDKDKLNAAVAQMRQTEHEPAGRGRLYYAVFVGDRDQGGLANDIPDDVACGWLGAAFDYSRPRHVHEMGHLLGRPHATTSAQPLAADHLKQGYCREESATDAPDFPFFARFVDVGTVATLGDMFATNVDFIYGYDHNAGVVANPFATAELMSYCPFLSRWRWPSAYTYTNLWMAITNRFPVPAPIGLDSPNPEQDYLLIRGEVNLLTDTAQFLPVSWTRTDVVPNLPRPGNWTLQLLDQGGTVLSEIAFDLDVHEPDFPAAPSNMGSFIIPVPADPQIKQAVLRQGATVLASVKASANPPVVTVLSPNGGETIGPGPVTISWKASDVDGDPLTYLVQFSADNGVHWQTLAVDWHPTSYQLDSSFLAGTAAGKMRVVASDGFNTSFDDSDAAFTVLNHPPNVQIVHPVDGAIVVGAQQVVFDGVADDTEDGAIPMQKLQWISDRDGPLGNGESIQRSAQSLSEGTHHIQFVAQDNGGLTSTGMVQITVMRQVPANLADLALTVTAASAQDESTGSLAFTIQAENNGPNDASQVLVAATIPTNATLVSVTAPIGSWVTNGASLEWTLPSLAADSASTMTVVAMSKDQAEVTLTGQVMANVTDPDPSNNSATGEMTPPPVLPRLSIRVQNSTYTLAWPAAALGFILESASSLTPGTVWQAETSIINNGQENSFNLVPSAAARFYRLRRP
jgi:uncharacterized repeat protein (TIGR01451 family)